MTKTVMFVNADGSRLEVEVSGAGPQAGTSRASRLDQIPELTQKAFEESLDKLRPIADCVTTKLKELNNPDEVTVGFGIKISAETGVVFASAAAEANFSINLRWKRE